MSFAALPCRPGLIRFQLLPPLLLLIQRRLHLQQSFGQFHLDPSPNQIHALQELLGIRHQKLSLIAPNHQQGRFSRSKLHFGNHANQRSTIHYFASRQFTCVRRARFQLRTLLMGNL